MKTMNELYGDGSDHEACNGCGFCNTCGDCRCQYLKTLQVVNDQPELIMSNHAEYQMNKNKDLWN